MRRLVVVPLALVTLTSVLAAQAERSATAPRPAFEAASVKRNRSRAGGGGFGEQPGGRWSMVNTAVASLIRSAYPSLDVIGAPGWVESEPYDIVAKADGNPTREQFALMLRTLLADRFKFAAHEETRDRPVFALMMSRRDQTLGPGLLASKIDCAAVNAARRGGRTPEGPLPRNGAPPCGWSSNGETLRVGGLPMAKIADVLGKPDGRTVIDKTGLPGVYEFTLRYTTDPASTDDRPSLFTALQDQLGLKLVPDRAPLRMLVVDRIERPTED